MFRFFTDYGTWVSPDLALFKFVDAILNDRPIDIYNPATCIEISPNVDDLVRGIRLLIDAIPVRPATRDDRARRQPFARCAVSHRQYRQFAKGALLDFIDAIEDCLGKKAIRNYMPMQVGDVPATWATPISCNV